MRLLIFLRCLLLFPMRMLRQEWARSEFLSRGISVTYGALLYRDSGCRITAGQGCSIGPGTVMLAQWDWDEGLPCHIIIGEHTGINEYNNLRAVGGDIRIGSHCQIAQFCTLVAANHTTETIKYMRDTPLDLSKASITIEDDVWIGANSVILPGVTIGRGAVIGAGSVVTRDVAPYTVSAGNPCRALRVRNLHA
jgi:carbonic anhydrase/acetyltransferase-like protein (isoleucine patch superfamily)